MLLQSIREKLRLWWELCENKKTAAEKVIILEVAHLHDALVQLEAKVVHVTLEEAKKIRSALPATHNTEQLDGAIAAADKQQAELDKQAATAASKGSTVPAPAVEAPKIEAAAEVAAQGAHD